MAIKMSKKRKGEPESLRLSYLRAYRQFSYRRLTDETLEAYISEEKGGSK